MRLQSVEFLVASSVCLSTFIATPVVIAALKREGVLDIPNERSSHAVPTPRGGGLACLVGGAVGLWVASRKGHKVPIGLPFASASLATVGLLDDRYGLSPWSRLGAQAVVGALSSTGGPLGRAVGLVVTPTVVNAVNFMDGINGMTALTTLAWGVTMVELGSVTLPDQSILLSGATAIGLGAGFLPWNAPEAQIFLGDVGSYLIGGMISATAFGTSSEGHHPKPSRFLLVLAPLLPYFVDTGSVLVKKAVKGEPLTAAHRDHFYQRLVSRFGIPHLTTSLAYSLSAGAVGVGMSVYYRLRVGAEL